MDMKTKALTQAPEALKFAYNDCDDECVRDMKIYPAIGECEKALKQPEQPPMSVQPEPVESEDTENTLHWHAFNYRNATSASAQQAFEKLEAFVKALAQPEQEPVAWLFTNQNGKGIQAFANEPPPGLKKKCKPLYTTPPQPKPQPLTEAQIDTGRRAPWGINLDAFTAGVRFAEADHGITGGAK